MYFPIIEELMPKIKLGEFDWEGIHYQVGTVGLGEWGQLCLQTFSAVKDTSEYQRWVARREREELDVTSSPSSSSSELYKRRLLHLGRDYSSAKPCHSYSKSRLRNRAYKTTSTGLNTSNNFSLQDQISSASMRKIKEFANGEVFIHDTSDLSDCESFTTCDSSRSDSETMCCSYTDSGDADCSDMEDERPYCSRWSVDVVDDVLRWHIDKYIQSVDYPKSDTGSGRYITNINHRYHEGCQNSNDDPQQVENPQLWNHKLQYIKTPQKLNHGFQHTENPQQPNHHFQHIDRLQKPTRGSQHTESPQQPHNEFHYIGNTLQLEESQHYQNGGLQCNETQHNQNCDPRHDEGPLKPTKCQNVKDLLSQDCCITACSGLTQTEDGGDTVRSLTLSLVKNVFNEDEVIAYSDLNVDNVRRLEKEPAIESCPESQDGQGSSSLSPGSEVTSEPDSEYDSTDSAQDVTVTFQHTTSPMELADDSVKPEDGGHTVRCVVSLEKVLRELEKRRLVEEQAEDIHVCPQTSFSDSRAMSITSAKSREYSNQRCLVVYRKDSDERRIQTYVSQSTGNKDMYPDIQRLTPKETKSCPAILMSTNNTTLCEAPDIIDNTALWEAPDITERSADEEEYQSATEGSRLTPSTEVTSQHHVVEPFIPGVLNDKGLKTIWNPKKQQSRCNEQEHPRDRVELKEDVQIINRDDTCTLDLKKKQVEVIKSFKADDICILGKTEEAAEDWSIADDAGVETSQANDPSTMSWDKSSKDVDTVRLGGINIRDKSLHDSDLELEVIVLEGSVLSQQNNGVNVRVSGETNVNPASSPQSDIFHSGPVSSLVEGCSIS